MRKEIFKLENRAKRRNLQRITLEVISNAGLIGVALIAPNVLRSMKSLGLIPYKRQNESIIISRNRLIKKKYVEFHQGKLRITGAGRAFLNEEMVRKKIFDKKNKKWDKKWRVLIFDIPDKRTLVRNQIRRNLRSVGFMRLQNSVWVYPYDCEDFVTLLKAKLKIGKDVLYLIVEELEYDKQVKSYFGLTED